MARRMGPSRVSTRDSAVRRSGVLHRWPPAKAMAHAQGRARQLKARGCRCGEHILNRRSRSIALVVAACSRAATDASTPKCAPSTSSSSGRRCSSTRNRSSNGPSSRVNLPCAKYRKGCATPGHSDRDVRPPGPHHQQRPLTSCPRHQEHPGPYGSSTDDHRLIGFRLDRDPRHRIRAPVRVSCARVPTPAARPVRPES